MQRLSAAFLDAIQQAHALARSGETGEPLAELIRHARDLLALIEHELDAQLTAYSDQAKKMKATLAEELAAIEALVRQGNNDDATA